MSIELCKLLYVETSATLKALITVTVLNPVKILNAAEYLIRFFINIHYILIRKHMVSAKVTNKSHTETFKTFSKVLL